MSRDTVRIKYLLISFVMFILSHSAVRAQVLPVLPCSMNAPAYLPPREASAVGQMFAIPAILHGQETCTIQAAPGELLNGTPANIVLSQPNMVAQIFRVTPDGWYVQIKRPPTALTILPLEEAKAILHLLGTSRQDCLCGSAAPAVVGGTSFARISEFCDGLHPLDLLLAPDGTAKCYEMPVNPSDDTKQAWKHRHEMFHGH